MRAKSRPPGLKKAQPKGAQQLEALRRERDESLARETAISNIPCLISNAPTDVQAVVEGILSSAGR